MADLFAPAECNTTNLFAPTASDAGIAGIGILLSFIITGGLALVLSASIVVGEMRDRPSTVRRKLLSSYSDQQILQGIGIQAVGLAKVNDLVPYHFFLIWMLSLLSMATHNATLLALVRDFRRDWILRWMRQFLMLVNLVLSCVYGVFVLRAVQVGLQDATLPIICSWRVDNPAGAPGSAGSSFAGTIVVIIVNCILFGLSSLYLHTRRQRFYKIVQVVGLVLMAAVAVVAVVRILTLSQAFGRPAIELSDKGERAFSFGQLLSLLLLLLPVVSVIEIWRGDMRVPEPTSDGSCVYEGEMQLNPKIRIDAFQPNPFFGSQTNLFKK